MRTWATLPAVGIELVSSGMRTFCDLAESKEDGERGRNRTYNLLIKSQLLCQLSYAPTRGDLTEGTIRDCNIFADAWSWLRLSSSRSQRAVILSQSALGPAGSVQSCWLLRSIRP